MSDKTDARIEELLALCERVENGNADLGDWNDLAIELFPWSLRELKRAREALKSISTRIDELETDDHRAVDFVELRGLQEEAEKALEEGGE